MKSRMTGVLNDFLVELIDTALYGFHQSAPSYNDIICFVKWEALFLEFFNDRLFTVVKFVHDERITAEFFEWMINAGMHYYVFINKDSYLRGNHSWVNSQYFHKISLKSN